ncbi:hypothetical protein GCM10017557_45760 [Streptomyces aurantiacus]|uniref:Uncharacterized protein n=1 Tax=Streptomyces aurantiacus TaxID=47760 RepID=A0A7G1P7D1_9ACTN|nr:hypothetical protein GCM10017557_45760 [Streptomyces aurantiacus]
MSAVLPRFWTGKCVSCGWCPRCYRRSGPCGKTVYFSAHSGCPLSDMVALSGNEWEVAAALASHGVRFC